MAVERQIIRESGTYANLIAGPGSAIELQPGMMGIPTDRLNMIYREPTGAVMHALLEVVAGAGVAGRVPFFCAGDEIEVDAAFQWDNVNKRLGVGTATPEAPFTVRQGASGAVAMQANTRILLEDNADAFIGLLVPAANECGIFFGSNVDPDIGAIRYTHTTNVLRIIAAATERIGIAAGHVFVNRLLSGATPDATADDFVVEGPTTVGMSLLCANAQLAYFAAGEAGGVANALQMIFNPAGRSVVFNAVGVFGDMVTIQAPAGVGLFRLHNGVTLRLGTNHFAMNVAAGTIAGNLNWDRFFPVQEVGGATIYVPCSAVDPS